MSAGLVFFLRHFSHWGRGGGVEIQVLQAKGRYLFKTYNSTKKENQIFLIYTVRKSRRDRLTSHNVTYVTTQIWFIHTVYEENFVLFFISAVFYVCALLIFKKVYLNCSRQNIQNFFSCVWKLLYVESSKLLEFFLARPLQGTTLRPI